MANYCRAVIKSPRGTTRHNTAAAPRPLPQLPNDLTRAPTVFVRRDGHVPPLQPLYDDTCAVICPSLHHFTLRIGDKEEKVSTLDSSPAPTLQRRLRSPGSGAARRRPIRDFSPPGAAMARREYFAPQQPAEPRWEPFSPGPPPGVFARPASILDLAAARPACNRQAPSRLDL
jgi:hypothetical protein